jgi:hypothetical protein
MLAPSALSPAAIDVLGQLFVQGPVWDGNVVSKAGRGELVRAGLAFHSNGWTSLTEEGVWLCVYWDRADLKKKNRGRWLDKLRAS